MDISYAKSHNCRIIVFIISFKYNHIVKAGSPGSTPSVIAYGDATFLKGTAFVVEIKFT